MLQVALCGVSKSFPSPFPAFKPKTFNFHFYSPIYKIFSFNMLYLRLILPFLTLGSCLQQQPLLPTEVSSFAPSKWQHPGYVASQSQLDFIKNKVATKAQPWTDAYNQMLKDSDKYGKYVSGTRTSKAAPTVSCGPKTNPDIKCTDERGDALAAWANALAWYVSGDSTYAKNAVGLMNKWSYTIKGIFGAHFAHFVLANRLQVMLWTMLFCRQPGPALLGPEQES
jgi:hypothetical protein